jgi:hypothetical protein
MSQKYAYWKLDQKLTGTMPEYHSPPKEKKIQSVRVGKNHIQK